MYAAIDNGTILAICHDARNAWDTLAQKSGSYHDAQREADRLIAELPPEAPVGMLAIMRDTVYRRHGVNVTRVVQDLDGAWRATNY